MVYVWRVNLCGAETNAGIKIRPRFLSRLGIGGFFLVFGCGRMSRVSVSGLTSCLGLVFAGFATEDYSALSLPYLVIKLRSLEETRAEPVQVHEHDRGGEGYRDEQGVVGCSCHLIGRYYAVIVVCCQKLHQGHG